MWFFKKKKVKKVYRKYFNLFLCMKGEYIYARFYDKKEADKELIKLVKLCNRKKKLFKIKFDKTIMYINPLNVTKIYILEGIEDYAKFI